MTESSVPSPKKEGRCFLEPAFDTTPRSTGRVLLMDLNTTDGPMLKRKHENDVRRVLLKRKLERCAMLAFAYVLLNASQQLMLPRMFNSDRQTHATAYIISAVAANLLLMWLLHTVGKTWLFVIEDVKAYRAMVKLISFAEVNGYKKVDIVSLENAAFLANKETK